MSARQSLKIDQPKEPLPEKKDIKGLPRNADIARTSSGSIAAYYRYRSKSDLSLSGGKSVRHLPQLPEPHDSRSRSNRILIITTEKT